MYEGESNLEKSVVSPSVNVHRQIVHVCVYSRLHLVKVSKSLCYRWAHRERKISNRDNVCGCVRVYACM